jgi:hypothetical protein
MKDDEFTITCSKCKEIEDTFSLNEIPTDYGWLKYRNKWYCKPCSLELK